MLVHTLKIAAGRFNFLDDQRIELPDVDARELIACGAVRPVEEAPRATRRRTATRRRSGDSDPTSGDEQNDERNEG